jgi:hypothetical protein
LQNTSRTESEWLAIFALTRIAVEYVRELQRKTHIEHRYLHCEVDGLVAKKCEFNFLIDLTRGRFCHRVGTYITERLIEPNSAQAREQKLRVPAQTGTKFFNGWISIMSPLP